MIAVMDEFKAYWDSLGSAERAALAETAGTSYGHLRNIAYGYRVADAALAMTVETLSRGSVMRWHLRPDDWHAIWPELTKHRAAPRVANQS